ncbi:hypothetical protein BS330_43595 [Amycolatopsis keratiniphila subsp. nogabecina]|nr:hypothetical protein BS330_43595 [Amycolatopsis keratiniphila subsp. nogabecina]
MEQLEPSVDAGSEERVQEIEPQLPKEVVQQDGERVGSRRTLGSLVRQTRKEDAAHRAAHQQPAPLGRVSLSRSFGPSSSEQAAQPLSSVAGNMQEAVTEEA